MFRCVLVTVGKKIKKVRETVVPMADRGEFGCLKPDLRAVTSMKQTEALASAIFFFVFVNFCFVEEGK